MQDGYDQTLSGLLRKRDELSGQVLDARERWEAATVSLEAIDAAIRVFNPAIKVSELPTRKLPHQRPEGSQPVQRFLLELLRRTGKPVRTLEGAKAVMAERGIDPRDRVMATLIRKTVGDAFGRLRKAGHVTGFKYGCGAELEWKLARG